MHNLVLNGGITHSKKGFVKKFNQMKGFLWLLVFVNIASSQVVNRPIGINVARVSDFSTELVFTDAFKQSRAWISSNATPGGPWDTGIAVPLNENGYPLEIPYNDGTNPPQIVKTLMLWDIGDAVPVGWYRLIVSGSGQVRLQFGATGTFNCPTDVLVYVNGKVMLEILQSDPSNPIHDIKFIYPDYVNTYQTQEYTNEFLSFLQNFQVIRFMNFTRTNGSNVVHWSDRTLPTYYTQSKSTGVAWEKIVEIANLTQKDIWINIPHKATDDYVLQLAQLLHNSLQPNIKIYLEFSNEIWNSSFAQHAECAAMGQALGYTGAQWERALKFAAKRSADIFKIFEDVFVDDSRLIKVLASQAANSGLSNQYINFFKSTMYNPHQITAHALAIAPYFANSVADQIVADGVVHTITIPEIITRMQNSLPQAYNFMLNSKNIANSHGLQLICYEGGQHLVATGANVNNNTLTEKLIAANLHPDMQELYCQYFNHWYENFGSLFCHYSSHGIYNKWGSWGLKVNYQDVNNPKYLGLQNCVFSHNGNLGIENTSGDTQVEIFPNPSKGEFFISFPKIIENCLVEIFATDGKLVYCTHDTQTDLLSIRIHSTGRFFVRIHADHSLIYKNILIE